MAMRCAAMLLCLLCAFTSARPGHKKKHEPHPSTGIRGRECGQVAIEAKNISGCKSLEHVLYIGHKNAEWIGHQLHFHDELEFLDLHHTKMGDDDAEAIASGLKNNHKLRRLQMHNNRIYDRGTTALAEALKTNTALEFLSMSSNGVGDDGAVALAEALKVNTGLRRLDLYFNLIADRGAIALAEALKVNTGLRTLHLDSNRIEDAGARAIAEALEANTGLSELTLAYNKVMNEGAIKLATATRSKKHMHHLLLDGNHQVHGEGLETYKATKVDLKERLEVVHWMVEAGLVADRHLAKEHPPLRSPFAAAVQALRLHTPEGIAALASKDGEALRALPELASLGPEKREQLVKVLLAKTGKGLKDEV